jgi:YjbE family integral membrane protein
MTFSSGVFDLGGLGALLTVVIIDVVLAGDNAVVVAMAAAGLPRREQARVIAFGIAAATILRIALAVIAVRLLDIIGLTLAGGILLLWVAWKMWREMAASSRAGASSDRAAPRRSFGQALLRVILADVSMSLDNILAIAGTARQHVWVLVIGLALSVVLMGIAAAIVARFLDRYRWASWIGLALVAGVAVRMIHDGWIEVRHVL